MAADQKTWPSNSKMLIVFCWLAQDKGWSLLFRKATPKTPLVIPVFMIRHSSTCQESVLRLFNKRHRARDGSSISGAWVSTGFLPHEIPMNPLKKSTQVARWAIVSLALPKKKATYEINRKWHQWKLVCLWLRWRVITSETARRNNLGRGVQFGQEWEDAEPQDQ